MPNLGSKTHDSSVCACICCKAKRGETRGKNNPFYGKKHTEHAKKLQREAAAEGNRKFWGTMKAAQILRNSKISKAKTGVKFTEEHKKNLRESPIKNAGHVRYWENVDKTSPEFLATREKHKVAMDRYWANVSPEKRAEHLHRAITACASRKSRPNWPERKLLSILEDMFPGQYKYTGNGAMDGKATDQVWIGGKNPDFMNVNGQKKLIEHAGKRWHGEEYEVERSAHFRKFGFSTCIVWARELKIINRTELKAKLLAFHEGAV